MGFRDLSRDECLGYLARVPVARVGVTIGALPAIFPVNFRMRGEDLVLFGAMANSRLALSNQDSTRTLSSSPKANSGGNLLR